MTNFNPDEQRSLMALLSGLQGGMTRSSGMSALQSILGQQQSRLAARDERMGSLIDLITSAAGQGQSLEAAQSLAGAYTAGSNIPPRIEDALGSLYPDPGIPGAPSVPSQFGGVDAAPNPAMQQSPVYMDPTTPQDELAQMQLDQAIQDQSATDESSPMISNALANQALGMITGATGEAPQDANTVIANLINSKSFQSLDQTTQAMTLQAIQTALETPGQGATGSPGPVIPGTGGLTGGAGVLTRARSLNPDFYGAG